MVYNQDINKYPFMGYETELKRMVDIVKLNLTAINALSERSDEENVCNMICAINGPVNQLSCYIDTLIEEKEPS
tara:strand:- start:208 stop:429 length:222 start_codon:yes stop_codon:yes gene_type:complete